MKYCVLDTETSGLNYNRHCILQMSGVTVGDDMQVIDEFDYLMKPAQGAKIEAEALKVQGRTFTSIQNHEWEPVEAFKDWQQTLDNCVNKFDKKDKMYFLAYNAPFDFQFVRYFYGLYLDKFFGSYFYWPAIDVAVLAAMYLQNKRVNMPDFKLVTVCDVMGVYLGDDAHDGLADAMATFEIFKKITINKML